MSALEQPQPEVQNFGDDAKKQAQQVLNNVQDDIKSVKPEIWGVSFGFALVLNIVLHLITKQKEDGALTVAVLFYTLFVGFLAIALRKLPIKNQFPYMVVGFSVARVFFNISAISVLLMSLAPFLVNTGVEELRKRDILKA